MVGLVLTLKLSAGADGSRLAIRGDIEFVGTVLVANPVSVHVRHFKDACSLGHARSLAHSTSLRPVTTRGLGSDQSTKKHIQLREKRW
jgi:hypothetical protein